jgi:hypothetical protein
MHAHNLNLAHDCTARETGRLGDPVWTASDHATSHNRVGFRSRTPRPFGTPTLRAGVGNRQNVSRNRDTRSSAPSKE